MSLMKTQRIAEEVRVAIARHGGTKVSIAQAIGLSSSQLSRRLSGSIPFSADEIANLAEHLGVPVGDLFPAPASAEVAA